MQPLHTFTADEHDVLFALLKSIPGNPYEHHAHFVAEVDSLVRGNDVPGFFRALCDKIRTDREQAISDIHVLRNCPIDADLPELDLDDPVADKYAKKRTYIGEAFLALFARLTQTPQLAYGSRNNGDFFTDVIAINRYSGMQTGFSDSELVYHNDRTAHSVRADFIALLGMRCPADDLVYTGYIDGRDLLAHLSADEQATLRLPHFITPFDVYSRDTNKAQVISEVHPILENHHSFRYLDSMTRVAPQAPEIAKDALIAMKSALTRAQRTRHRLLDRDLLVFANQDALHNREKIEINDPNGTRSRWLLKTYAFRNQSAADRHADKWLNGTPGCVAD
ncbi:TauD/TfdA family dioxygenase [Jeongeupia wiesaeckerbachi]|uniref:TauD/TfdA family dioxygenase n=1 Tax=Jeongeupia wiesaeckerbachi TaxID=3051218 RepID=UPI003D808B8D